MARSERDKNTVKLPTTMKEDPPTQSDAKASSGSAASKFVEGSGQYAVVPDDLSSDEFLQEAPRVEFQGHTVPKLGKILLLKLLGKGAMGAVYYGLHANLRVGVAIKVLHAFLAEQDPVVIKRFFREAQTAARVNSPHLVNVTDVDEDSGLFYIVMEYVDGLTAADFIKRMQKDEKRRGATELEALDVMLAVTKGLAAAHGEGIIHRDIKPVNIMLPKKRGSDDLDLAGAKLADLGLARRVDSGSAQDLTRKFTAMGTPGYMAPEQVLNAKDVGKPADIFGMGGTFYSLLCGRAPFIGTSMLETMHLTVEMPPPPIGEVRADISDQVASIVYRCLEKLPGNRYQDAAELLDALVACHPATSMPDTTQFVTETPDGVPGSIVSGDQELPETVVREHGGPGDSLPRPVVEDALDTDSSADGELPDVAQRTMAPRKVLPAGPKPGEPVKPPPQEEPEPEPPVEEMAVDDLPKPTELACKSFKTDGRFPFGASEAKRRQKEAAKELGMPAAVSIMLTDDVLLDLNLIPAGRFLMGSPPEEEGRDNDEHQHYHLHTRPFFIGVNPVTQEQWEAVTGKNPSKFKGKPDSDKRPVERVSWTQIRKEFLPKIQSLAPAGWLFRLPSEAEWEYACRAGTETPYWFEFDFQAKQARSKWTRVYRKFKPPYEVFPANSGDQNETTAVGSYPRNPWGLYDVLGNVWEWCEDVYDPEFYRRDPAKDMLNTEPGEYRVVRGGGWNYTPEYARSANRYRATPESRQFNFGLRVAMVIVTE